VFRMFSKMSGQRIEVQSDHGVSLQEIVKGGVRAGSDVMGLASLDAKRLCMLVWHYHDDDVPGPTANVALSAVGLPEGVREATLEHFRIDEDHSNSFAVWKRMGSPQIPTAEQYAELQRAGKLGMLEKPRKVAVEKGQIDVKFSLPRQVVSLVVVEWE
jgi:xylan 1,4-beta-xylosidase